MNEIGMMLKKNRNACGMSQGSLSKELEKQDIRLSAKTISGYENGISEPNASLFLTLCKILEINDPVNEFYSMKNGTGTILNSEGMDRLREYTGFLLSNEKFVTTLGNNPSVSSKKFISKAEDLSKNTSPKAMDKEKPSDITKPKNNIISFSNRDKNRKVIPIFDLAVSAGAGDFLDSENFELKEADEGIGTLADFGVRVSGDSMMPRIKDGDTLYVRKQDTLNEGEIGIFSLDGNAYVKKFHVGKNGIALISLNKKYSPINVGEYSELKIFGKVLLDL